MLRLRSLSIPTLCAVNGVVAASGFQLAMGCDILLATKISNFSCPGIKWGLFCSTPGVELVRAITSQKKANEFLLFGESFPAE
jgi:enoyl-CoA hydratase/carnithine racemase